MKYLINSVAFGRSKHDIFDAKSIISALMRNGGVLNTRVFGIDMSSCRHNTELSAEDSTDINGMRAFRARKYIYHNISHEFVEMNVQQIAGRGPKVVIARSDLEGSTTTERKPNKKNALSSATTSSSATLSTSSSSSFRAGSCTASNDSSCPDAIISEKVNDISATTENKDSGDLIFRYTNSTRAGSASQNKGYSYGDSTGATLWESSGQVDTTNLRRRKQIKLVISSEDPTRRKRVRHSRAVKKNLAAKSKAATKAATQFAIKAKCKTCYACIKPNCNRKFLSQLRLNKHVNSGKCYNGIATQCVTTTCKKFDKAKNVTGIWKSKPSVIPKLDFCIQLAQNDQLTTARLDTRELANSSTVILSPISSINETLLKPERRSKGKSSSNDTATQKTHTAHNLTLSEAAAYYFVPSPHHLGALKAKSTKTPRMSSQLQCVVQAFRKGADDKKEKLTSTQFANQMALMGTFLGEEKFPNNAWMKCNPHGFPTFAKIELLNRHQVKSYFGTGQKKLESTYQNLLDKELSTCELDFITSIRSEILISSMPLILRDIIADRFASHLRDKEQESYELTAGKIKYMISAINSKSKIQFWLPRSENYAQTKIKELKEAHIYEYVIRRHHTFIRPLL